MQLKSIHLIILLVALLFVQEIKAQFLCEVFNTCTSTSAAPGASSTKEPSPSATSSAPASSSSALLPSSSSVVPSSSSIKPSSSSKPPVTSSASPTSSSVAPSSTSSEISSVASTSMSSTTPSASASETPTSDESPGGSNVGVIVGSVCGFVAIIGAGFAYAFFSKTRRNNRRNKRLYSENGDPYEHPNSYQPDPFNNTRPSPAMAASAIAAADDIHKHNNNHGQWEMAEQQPYGYNNAMMSPQPPMATVAKQHDPYYNSPQMGYGVDPNNYYNGQAYYDPNAGYQQQQHYDSHYDQHYAEPQYDPYQQQQQHASSVMNTNVMAPLPTMPQQTVAPTSNTATVVTTNSNVYQTPHSYPEDNQKTSAPTTAHNEGSYR
ncbi:cholesterol esterase [Mucor velutinosus]|uniref:Cholesterol esterase n=1 Tax=Mucor velutinosus TaxID=708070 RepID=A0AAN7DH70_9FUNG|nr:cholesterol esterase [Mucor velutinosus]